MNPFFNRYVVSLNSLLLILAYFLMVYFTSHLRSFHRSLTLLYAIDFVLYFTFGINIPVFIELINYFFQLNVKNYRTGTFSGSIFRIRFSPRQIVHFISEVLPSSLDVYCGYRFCFFFLHVLRYFSSVSFLLYSCLKKIFLDHRCFQLPRIYG